LSSTDADVRIILNAEDNASEVVTAASRRINREFTDWTRQNKALERSMILNNKTFFETAQTISRVGNIAQKGLGIWQSYNIQQMRVADAKKNVAQITRELNQAMADGDIEGAAMLTEQLADANAELSRTSMDANIQLAFMIPAFVGMASDIARLIPQVRSLAVAYGLLGRNAKGAVAGTALTGALGGLSAGGAGLGGAAVGGIGGKLKGVMGSTAGKFGVAGAIATAAGLGTYEFLTETDEGRAINEYNPFKLLADAVFMATHSSEEVARARAGQTVNIYGASTSETMDYLSQTTQEATVYE
jgi:hypothetical protein